VKTVMLQMVEGKQSHGRPVRWSSKFTAAVYCHLARNGEHHRHQWPTWAM